MKKVLFTLLIVGLVAGAASADLRAWYKFDETSGTAVADSSGNGFDATVNGTSVPEWDAGGAIGGCLQETSAAMTVDVPVGVFSTVTDAITVSWWAQRTEATAGGGFFCGYNAVGDEMLKAIPYKSGDDYYGVYRAGSTETKWWWGYGANSAVGEWDHFALVYDETAGTKKLYFNGEVVHNPGIDAGDEIADVSIFKLFVDRYDPDTGNVAGSWRCFSGKMDDFRVYDNALSDSEITALIPEPTTIALLGLGTLGLIRRKK